MHTFHAHSRDYSDWSIEPPLPQKIDPIQHGLLDGDTFDGELEQVDSHWRKKSYICGVLLIQGNKTFGKTKNGRIYYQCIPNDKALPIFLVPYDIKIGFNKNPANKYVTFVFDHWKEKHPKGLLKETLGDVDDYETFCQYQLWCRDLISSHSKWTRDIKNYFKQKTEEEFFREIPELEDKTNDLVYSIDPKGSTDLDDAFHIEEIDNVKIKITIHIANVFLILQHLNMLQRLSERVATVYLPHTKYTMLPEILSENICSLLENKTRASFAMEVIYDQQKNELDLSTLRFYSAKIKVRKNWDYNDPALQTHKDYILLKDVTNRLQNNESEPDSHDVVAYWMLFMNKQCAKTLHQHKTGIFRTVTLDKENTVCPDPVMKEKVFLWNQMNSQYIPFTDSMNSRHDLLDVEHYTHMTSPIRRLVDLLNQAYFYRDIFGQHIDNAFLKNMDTETTMKNIHQGTKSIKKVQSDCELIYLCKFDQTVMNEQQRGYIFDVQTDNQSGIYTYSVYILNKICIFRTHQDHELYKTYPFRLFLFDRENSGYRKVRLELV